MVFLFGMTFKIRTRTYLNARLRWSLAAIGEDTNILLRFFRAIWRMRTVRVTTVGTFRRIVTFQTTQHIVAFITAAFCGGIFTVAWAVFTKISGDKDCACSVKYHINLQ